VYKQLHSAELLRLARYGCCNKATDCGRHIPHVIAFQVTASATRRRQ